MFLAKILKKTLSVALVVALLCQQSGLVFATTNVSNWSDLQYYVANYADTYNVTTPLTASSSSGTLYVNNNGRYVTGYSLTQNGAQDTLISVGSGVTFNLGNTIYGSIANSGTLNYSGSYLSSGSIYGTNGVLNLSGSSITNNNTIEQKTVNVGSSTTLTNNSSIATNNAFNNSGAITGDGELTLNGTTNNSGSISQKITNNSNITGNGNIYLTGDSVNNGSISQNLVSVINNSTFNNNGSLMAKANNNLGSTLNSDPDNLGDDVANNGQLNLNGNGVLYVAVSGTGDTNINGDLDNQGTISQANVNVASGYVLTTNANDVVASNLITNDGIIHYTAGSTANTIVGNGRVDITGYLTNTGNITQNNVSNSGIFTNNGTVTANLTNTNTIEGTGSITTGTGVSSNNGIITQNTLTNNGTFENAGHIILTSLTNNSTGVFNTNADLLAISNNSIVNNGALHFTGGVNTNDITGTGTTYISGTVENGGNIANNIQVDINGNLGTVTDITSVVENRGILQLVDADITNTGRVKGTGVINILGETTNNSTIEGSTINITTEYGHLTTASDKVSANIVNEALLTWNGGTTNANAISGSGTLEITGGNIVNNATINQDNIYISNGALTSNADLLTVAGGIENDADLTLTGGVNKNVITGIGDMTITGDVTNKADIEQDTLTNNGNFLNDEGSIVADIVNSGNFINNDGLITGDITNNTSGTFASAGNVISGDITNNGAYIITEGDNANDITGTGNLTFQGETFNTGVINQNNINVDLGATLVASDISDITATNVLSNNGVLELQGGTNNNVIHSTTGTLKITGDVVNTSGKVIVQDNIDIATLGFLTADAGDLATINGITNSGQLTLNDGINSNDISGTGDLVIIGDVDNGGNISQASLTNSGSLTSDASKLAFTEGINNSGTVNFTAGTNENAITGAGDTNFTNDVVNNATIAQTNVTNAAGTLTNNANITADFTNDSGIVNNEAVISGAITNNSGIINSTADNLAGTVANDGTLNIAGGIVQDVITGSGVMNNTGDLVNNYAITQTTVNNSGIMDNTGVITAAITNSGTITSTADNLAGTIANDGILNITGGTVQDTISGNGELNITGDLVNYDTINQSSVYNEGHLTNNEVITADTIYNVGQINAAASDLVGNIVNDGTLVFDYPYSSGSSNISGTGDVEITGATRLNGTNTYTGTTLINGGELIISNQDNLVSSDILFANNGIEDGLLTVLAEASLDNLLKGQSAADNINVDNDFALTLTTAMGEAADFHKTGDGVMTFAMDSNNYTGNTYVDEGTLIGNTLNINNIVNGAAGTTVEFNDTADAELNEINTSGNFVKSGSALLNVETNAFTAAQADINSGIFAANRAITADVLNVNDGATLRGNGNITGNVNVNEGGTIAPGNSIDTLTITGDVNFASGSTTAIEINETPASDLLVITGNATIDSGANLTVSNENGRYFEWESFEIVNAGNVAGTFTYDGTITDYDASRIDVELDYSDPTKVLLTAKRKATDYETTAVAEGLSHNQSQAAKAVDNISTGYDGDITNALLQVEKLAGLNPAEVELINPDATLQSALDDVAGGLYANNALATLFNAKTAHVYDRIAKRNPSKGACPNCHDNVWAEYYNQYDKVYEEANSSRFTNNMSGVLAGYDRSSDKVLLGVYGGFGKSDLRQDNGSKMDLDDTTLGIYGGYRTGEWLFKGTMFAGIQHYNAKRAIRFMNRTAKGSYDGMNLGLDLEASYSIPVYNWLTVRPFVGWLNNYSHQNSFTETGAEDLNLHVFGNDQFNSQVRLGVQLEGKVSRLSWYGSAAVKQFVGDDYAKLHMNLSSMPSTDMEIISAELGRTYFSGQVGLSYAINNNLSIFGNLDTGVNNKSANCYGNIGLAFAW